LIKCEQFANNPNGGIFVPTEIMKTSRSKRPDPERGENLMSSDEGERCGRIPGGCGYNVEQLREAEERCKKEMETNAQG
jgi:hypothetical protein